MHRTKPIKTKSKIYDDEIEVKMATGLGLQLGILIMPKEMEEGLIKAYIESGAVESTYLYINGKEITDEINHNPHNVDYKLGEKGKEKK